MAVTGVCCSRQIFSLTRMAGALQDPNFNQLCSSVNSRRDGPTRTLLFLPRREVASQTCSDSRSSWMRGSPLVPVACPQASGPARCRPRGGNAVRTSSACEQRKATSQQCSVQRTSKTTVSMACGACDSGDTGHDWLKVKGVKPKF
jgi:hypothetical protein